MTQQSSTCPSCGKISYNPNDVINYYCGRCNIYYYWPESLTLDQVEKAKQRLDCQDFKQQFMFNPLDLDGLTQLIDNAPKLPIAVVVRPDVYQKLKECGEFKFKDAPLGFPGALPVFPDPAANSIAMSQTQECMLFYDNESLNFYLERDENPLAWVKYCCQKAGIPYPMEDEPGRQ